MTARTSHTHPMKIAELLAGGGTIGISFCPGKHASSLTGPAWARDLAIDLDVVKDWGADAVITLVEDHEIAMMKVPGLGRAVETRGIAWHYLPIVDVNAPSEPFEQGWHVDGPRIRSLLAGGGRVFVHCRGGLGRAGTVAARLLVEMEGREADEAIAMVRAVRPGALETRGQERHIHEVAARLDRAKGALLGLAIGDAVGTTLEFMRRDTYEHLTDMIGGGPFGLPVGVWTDDTSMALALADSLIHARENGGDFDAEDLMDRFVSWWKFGEYSPTGKCFDIGITTSRALGRYLSDKAPYAGDPDPYAAGNGSLMRLSPVAIAGTRWSADRTASVARLQSRTTHAAPACLDACAAYALMLRAAIMGASFEEAVAAGLGSYGTVIAPIVAGSWRGKSRDEIASSGFVAHSLEAALWCVDQTDNFRDAVLLAANLGDDADTTAAIAGQLAGGLYGVAGMPADWVAKVAWRDGILASAGALAA